MGGGLEDEVGKGGWGMGMGKGEERERERGRCVDYRDEMKTYMPNTKRTICASHHPTQTQIK